MKYLCLIYVDEQALERLPAEAVQQVRDDCHEHTASLQRSGQLIASERLQPVGTAVTVRRGSGRVAVTDGPFAETKEQLAGFYLVEARDLNEAIRIAERIPPGRLGSIEVRPVRESG